MSGYSLTRIVGALRRRAVGLIRNLSYQPGRVPLKNGVVLFNSFNGKSIGDSPLDIFFELQKTKPNLKFYFTTTNNMRAPEGSIGVRFESREWLELLASAEYLVSNNAFPWYFKKSAGQIYVQTWHGTPLKKLAHDIRSGGVSKTYLDNVDRESAAWNFLVSPSAYCSEIFARAFKYRGEILETGYPRNDRLVSPNAETRNAVRKKLGVTDPKTVLVLYAPTWREYEVSATGNFESVEYLDENIELPTNMQLMVRGHSMTQVSKKKTQKVIDVTAYPDIAELYLAADVLVTDFSSVMFDFSVTGKPMIFLAPDLTRYENERGFYFDFKAESPGPIVATQGEVVEILRSLTETAKTYASPYKNWQQKFNSLEDGSATKRVIAQVWGSKA